MTIKQLGGVFGRNPTFNDVTIEGQLTFDGDIDINSDLKVNGDLEVIGGNVGIGTVPSTELHVFSSTQDTDLQVESTFAGGDARLNLYANSAGVSQIRFGDEAETNIGLLTYDHTDDSMQFRVNDSERMRINSSGNVGIGTSPSQPLHVYHATTNGVANFQSGDANVNISLMDSATTAANYVGIGAVGNNLTFISGNGGEKARIDSSGNSLLGTTSTTADEGGIVARPDSNVSNIYIGHATGTADGSAYIRFRYGSGNIGSITQSGTAAVLYNTTSDQRLKDNIVDAPSASDDIDAIQVRSFDWKVDGSHQKYGMVAQELVTVAPSAVSQPEDPGEMMGVDYSKLVPMLIKEVQQLRARVAQLEGAN
jgi:hypothetical protein